MQKILQMTINRLKHTLKSIVTSQALKYAIVIIFAVVIVGFVDENSVYNHFKNLNKISDLQEEIDKYRAIYNRDQAQLYRLDNDPKAIEKIARERYFMKRADEDVFVLSTDESPEKTTTDETTE